MDSIDERRNFEYVVGDDCVKKVSSLRRLSRIQSPPHDLRPWLTRPRRNNVRGIRDPYPSDDLYFFACESLLLPDKQTTSNSSRIDLENVTYRLKGERPCVVALK